MNIKNRFGLATLLSIALVSFLIGMVCGVTGFWIGQHPPNLGLSQAPNNTPLPSLPTGGGQFRLPHDGIFLSSSTGAVVPLPEYSDLTGLQVDQLATTTGQPPMVFIKGDEYPLGNLQLLALYAGFGLDPSYGPAGATVNQVFPGSPAQLAAILPGDVIMAIEGEPLHRPQVESYSPGEHDLFGPMQAQVELEVITGTTSRTIQLARTFRTYSSELALAKLERKIVFRLEPTTQYLVLKPTSKLAPGVYAIVFRELPAPLQGDSLLGATPTPTARPKPLPPQTWIFVVEN